MFPSAETIVQPPSCRIPVDKMGLLFGSLNGPPPPCPFIKIVPVPVALTCDFSGVLSKASLILMPTWWVSPDSCCALPPFPVNSMLPEPSMEIPSNESPQLEGAPRVDPSPVRLIFAPVIEPPISRVPIWKTLNNPVP